MQSATITYRTGREQARSLRPGKCAHIVGTDPINAEGCEAHRAASVVHRPRDDSTANRVHLVDQLARDERVVRPEIQRSMACHRADGIRVRLIVQHAKPVYCSAASQPEDQRHIEAVYCARTVIPGERRRHQPFNGHALDLDEQLGSAAHQIGDGRECGDGLPRRRFAAKLLVAQLADEGAASQRRIVVYHDDAVRCGVDVELDSVGPGIERQAEAREGILPRQTRHAAVRNATRRSGRRCHGWTRQKKGVNV